MDREERIEAVIAEWYERRDAGEEVDPEELIGRHADLAGDLRARFAALEFVDLALARSSAAPDGVPREIGDFRILREIGRGGMGTVYEAEQISMGRRVALKILSPAVTNVAQAVRRFQREARAAGQIHHTNILPVYGMGKDQGLFHYPA